MRRNVWSVIVLTLTLPLIAFADKPQGKDKGKDKGKEKQQSESRDGNGALVTVTFVPEQREAARRYFTETYGRGKCPPGLAKKKNGCLPPGQAKKRYTVGRPWPEGVVLEDLPPQLVVRIGAPPQGYRYAILDGDIVKLAVGTALIVDAIEGLVN